MSIYVDVCCRRLALTRQRRQGALPCSVSLPRLDDGICWLVCASTLTWHYVIRVEPTPGCSRLSTCFANEDACLFDLKSMWPFQYRHGAAMVEEMRIAMREEKEQGLHHTYKEAE